jgi:selenium metabolism protein YedF
VTQEIDLRGMTCPEPVLKTKKLFDDPSVTSIDALVDDEVCVANLERLARSLKASSSSTRQDGHYLVSISRSEQATPHSHTATQPSNATGEPTSRQTVVFITKDQLGQGEEEFGRTLLNVFLQTLLESGHRPQAILMANTGVKLMSSNSPVLKVLEDFRVAGTEVLACGLCVKFYGLEEQIAKEQITSMFAICEYILAAGKVITP